MEIPSNILETITKAVFVHSPKYRIPGYELEDIQQEAYIMALECYEAYDEDCGPFENFLNKHLFYRLKNLVRNETLNDSIYKDIRKQLMCPLDISLVNTERENALVDKDNVFENVEREEILKKIDQYLPISLRKDYLKMKAGVKINRGRANKIKSFIYSLLDEFNGETEEED